MPWVEEEDGHGEVEDVGRGEGDDQGNEDFVAED